MNAIPSLVFEGEPVEAAQPENNSENNSPEKAQEKNPLAAEMLSIIEKVRKPDADPIRQAKALESLPSDFLLEMRAHVRHRGMDFSQYETKEDIPASDRKNGYAHVKGYLFELLVLSDDEIARPLSREGIELLGVMQNSGRFGFYNYGRRANPDATYIEEDSLGRIVINKVGEVKSVKHLKSSDIDQFESLETSVDYLIDYLNEQAGDGDFLRKHGLEALAERMEQLEGGDLIVKGENFETVLFIPRGKGTKYKNYVHYRAKRELTPRRYDEVMETMKVKRSCFDGNELYHLSNYVLDKIIDEELADNGKAERTGNHIDTIAP